MALADRDRYALASQLAVLRSCPTVIARLLKSAASLLLAAKVLVTSRLFHTKVSQRSNPPPYLENLRSRLATLRRRLLARIDKTMKKAELPKESLIEALCAFALATSSSSKDVLRHYHHIRLEAINEPGSKAGHVADPLQALKIYVNTLRDTRAIVPGDLARALERLKSAPILRSPDLHGLIELNLDLHERNLSDDIRAFTPYIRLDDLHKAESEQLLKQWGKQAFFTVLGSFRASVDDIDDPYRIMDLRTETFKLWFSNQHHAVGIDTAEIVDGFRDLFNSQWSNIVDERTSSLENAVSVVQQTLQQWSDDSSTIAISLWEPTGLTIDTSNGARTFREALTSSLQGHNKPVRILLERYAQWRQSIEGIEDVIQKISNLRWEDDLNAVDDDDDDVLNDKQVLLSEDDPRSLRKGLVESLASSFSHLESSMEKTADSLVEDDDEHKAVFLLRVWREVRQHLPQSYRNEALGVNSIATLQRLVAENLCRSPLERGSKRMAKASKTGRVAGQVLWEGEPPIPVLPSPWVFRLLRELSAAMGNIGTDIWSPDCITVLKRHLSSSLEPTFERTLQPAPEVNGHHHAGVETEQGDISASNEDDEQTNDSTSPPKVNGITSDGESTEPPHDGRSQEVATQQLFDLVYLASATKLKDTNEQAQTFGRLQASAEEDLQLPIEPKKMLKKGAEEYWKRTSLLFALLA